MGTTHTTRLCRIDDGLQDAGVESKQSSFAQSHARHNWCKHKCDRRHRKRAFRDPRTWTQSQSPAASAAASIPQAAANMIADRIGIRACRNSFFCLPSGLMRSADAAEMIRSGEAEIAIAGGADAPITPLTMASFIASGMARARNGDPEDSKPTVRCSIGTLASFQKEQAIFVARESGASRGTRAPRI